MNSTQTESPTDAVVLARLGQRASEEFNHRTMIHREEISFNFHPNIQHADRLYMSHDQIATICNKTAPLYFTSRHTGPLDAVIHTYMYRRWFKPYQSELGWGRFLCKFLAPDGLPAEKGPPSNAVLNSLLHLNKCICKRVGELRRNYKLEIATNTDYIPSEIKNHECYILQPLFRAIIIVACPAFYDNEDWKSVGKVPVYLIRTGHEQDLSAPITFHSISNNILSRLTGVGAEAIQVPLEAAVDFVMGLEAREAAVFGLQPDPMKSWYTWPEMLKMCGVPQGEEHLHGPSSKFVDPNSFPGWSESALRVDTWIRRQEKGCFVRLELKSSGKLDLSRGYLMITDEMLGEY